MNIIGMIPARLQSTRLPRKLLLDATGNRSFSMCGKLPASALNSPM